MASTSCSCPCVSPTTVTVAPSSAGFTCRFWHISLLAMCTCQIVSQLPLKFTVCTARCSRCTKALTYGRKCNESGMPVFTGPRVTHIYHAGLLLQEGSRCIKKLRCCVRGQDISQSPEAVP
jgi:hypothetical protein